MKNEHGLKIAIADGELQGGIDDGIFVFKGIPYAAPPVGTSAGARPSPSSPGRACEAHCIFLPRAGRTANTALRLAAAIPAISARTVFISMSGRLNCSPISLCR